MFDSNRFRMAFLIGLVAVGLAALSVVLVALLVAITLVPALLSLMTRWVSRRGVLSRLPVVGSVAHTFGDAPPAEGFFSRLAARVQRHRHNQVEIGAGPERLEGSA